MTTDEQIDALLTNTAPAYVSRQLGLSPYDSFAGRPYRKVFAVERHQVLEYLAKRHAALEDYGCHYSLSILAHNGKWLLRYSFADERFGDKLRETEFDTLDAARQAMLDEMLSRTYERLDWRPPSYPKPVRRPWWQRWLGLG